MDLNTGASFKKSGNTAYKTQNTHEIITGGKNPISVRSWSGVGQELVRTRYEGSGAPLSIRQR